MNRGDVVLALIPYIDGTGGKHRAVLIVQGDSFNQSALDTIIAAVSTNLQGAGQANQLLIDPATARLRIESALGREMRSALHHRSTFHRPHDRQSVGGDHPNTSTTV